MKRSLVGLVALALVLIVTDHCAAVPAREAGRRTHCANQLTTMALFLESGVAAGAIEGVGAGELASLRLNALHEMIALAGDLTDEGHYGLAELLLWAALLRCDGNPRPPDFVTGPGVPELAAQLRALLRDLESLRESPDSDDEP